MFSSSSLSLPSDVHHLFLSFRARSGGPFDSRNAPPSNPYTVLYLTPDQHSSALAYLTSAPRPWVFLSLRPDIFSSPVPLGYLYVPFFLARCHWKEGVWRLVVQETLCPRFPLSLGRCPSSPSWSLDLYRPELFVHLMNREFTLFDVQRAIQTRLLYYTREKTEYTIPDLATLKEDVLGFHLITSSFSHPDTNPSWGDPMKRQQVRLYLLEQETRLFRQRLVSCLSTETHLWTLLRSFGMISYEIVLSKDIPDRAWKRTLDSFYGVIPSPTLRWIVLPFDSTLVAPWSWFHSKQILLRKGFLYLHLGFLFDLVLEGYRSQLDRLCLRPCLESPSPSCLVDSLQPYHKQIVLAIHRQLHPKAPLPSVVDQEYATIDQILPACLRRMKQYIPRSLKSTDLFYFFRTDRLIFISGMRAAGVSLPTIQRRMTERIPKIYPVPAQAGETRAVLIDIEDLYHKKKLDYGCLRVQERTLPSSSVAGGREKKKWCPYTLLHDCQKEALTRVGKPIGREQDQEHWTKPKDYIQFMQREKAEKASMPSPL